MQLWISGTGSALPKKVVTNDDLAKVIETSDEWIYSRTGIRQRHVADETESVESLGRAAAERALEMAGVSAEEIGLIIVGTCTTSMRLARAFSPPSGRRRGSCAPALRRRHW